MSRSVAMGLVRVKYCSQREWLSWSDVQYSTSQNTNIPWLTANDRLLPCFPGTTWPCYSSNCCFDTPRNAADRSGNQGSTTWSWSEKSRFSSVGAFCIHSKWIAIIFRFSSLKRPYYVNMVRRVAEHYINVLWYVSWIQSGMAWVSTRAIPISDWKPPWHAFGNNGENIRRTTRLSHYGP